MRKREFFIILLIPICLCFANTGFAGDMEAMDMSKHESHASMMHGFYGAYPMTRESSGTSWQPDSSPTEGVHAMKDDWMFMMHGYANAIYDIQGGPRGDDMFFSTNMLMFMMQHPFFNGTWGFRSMASLEPTIGRDGYPLLFQTGETANGVTHLVDRQHPHDFIMELATTYSLPISSDSSAFIYFGLPGEPALGPTTFMHRFSGEVIPDAPITHHWLDSTHITYGVITFGYIKDGIKVENSFFRGREPDQFRWNIETPRFDSYCVRATINPDKNLSCQISYGHLISPEQLTPDTDVDRLTASVAYNKTFRNANWQTTVAYGENWNDPGRALPAYLAESAITFSDKYTFFGRGEFVYKDELFQEGSPLEGKVFSVGKAEAGFLYDFLKTNHIYFGIGYSASLYFYSNDLDGAYGDATWSHILFARIKV
jgi:hypothetical protein